MNFWQFVALVVIAAIVGSIGEALAGYSHPGCAVSVIVGFLGAYIGQWIRSYFGWPMWLTVKVGTTVFPIVWSIIGAALLVFLVRIVFGSRRRRRD